MIPKLPMISDLICREVKPEDRKQKMGIVTALSEPIRCPRCEAVPRLPMRGSQFSV